MVRSRWLHLLQSTARVPSSPKPHLMSNNEPQAQAYTSKVSSKSMNSIARIYELFHERKGSQTQKPAPITQYMQLTGQIYRHATLLLHIIVQRTGLLALAGVASPGARSSALTAVPSMLSHIGGAPAVLCLSPSASSRALLAIIASALSKLQGSSACMSQVVGAA